MTKTMTSARNSCRGRTNFRLNAELESEGFVTIKGRVSTQYFMERIYGLSTDKEVG